MTALAAAIAWTGTSTLAHAGTFPGTNGKIAFTEFTGACADGQGLAQSAGGEPDSRTTTAGATPQAVAPCLGAIWTMNPDGSGRTNLTTDLPNANNQFPSWSGDGTKIAFVSGPTSSTGDIWVMNADGSGKVNVTNDASVGRFMDTFSPDGTKIAFVSDHGGHNQLWVVNVDGSGLVQVTTNTGGGDFTPAWSPDGTKIAYSSELAGGLEHLFVVGADGSNPVDLTPSLDNQHYASNPTWSPDGNRIAFETVFTQGNDDLWVMNADGSSPTDLTNDGTTENSQPTWSPDGTHIAWVKFDFGSFTAQVYVMNADGTNPENVTADPSHLDSHPAWQPIPVPIAAPAPAPIVIAPTFTG
jgi:TolB protein